VPFADHLRPELSPALAAFTSQYTSRRQHIAAPFSLVIRTAWPHSQVSSSNFPLQTSLTRSISCTASLSQVVAFVPHATHLRRYLGDDVSQRCYFQHGQEETESLVPFETTSVDDILFLPSFVLLVQCGQRPSSDS
jgi:hypothetical protein